MKKRLRHCIGSIMFQIVRNMIAFQLNFLQYILNQEETSIFYTMLEAQTNHPVQGDWFFECLKILKSFNIDHTIEDIKLMTKKSRIRETSNLSTVADSRTDTIFERFIMSLYTCIFRKDERPCKVTMYYILCIFRKDERR